MVMLLKNRVSNRGLYMRINVKRHIFKIVGGLLAIPLVGGMLLAPTASAAVWDCVTKFEPIGPTGYCGSGDSTHFKANIMCINIFNQTHVISGPWQPVGGNTPSVIGSCPPFESYHGPIYMTGN